MECGRTQLEVSEELGIVQSVISRLWQRFQDDGNVSRCYSTGLPRVTTPNEDRYIWQLLPKETDGAWHQICLFSSLQLPVRQFQGSQTVYRRLGHIGLYARSTVRYVALTATHCRQRFTWSREHAL
ncbi:HTH_Tnp_Tc3_2 domain-containing protein [Trichonephila clavipes]|nr:HTH_Tnp_Tc3_2 domain-containing protein [Trichonephila clavipes]